VLAWNTHRMHGVVQRLQRLRRDGTKIEDNPEAHRRAASHGPASGVERVDLESGRIGTALQSDAC